MESDHSRVWYIGGFYGETTVGRGNERFKIFNIFAHIEKKKRHLFSEILLETIYCTDNLERSSILIFENKKFSYLNTSEISRAKIRRNVAVSKLFQITD